MCIIILGFSCKGEIKVEIIKTNFAVIGCSGRGSSMMRELSTIPGVNIVAVCDIFEDRAKKGAEIIKDATGKEPDIYIDYKELLARKDISAVLCCTTWITHSRIAIDTMKAGKNVAIEVGGAASIEECWQMVRTSEETGKFCMLLENCCYCRDELAIFNMCRQGVLGEIVHVQGGYEHDLRKEIGNGREIRHGRIHNFMNRNGELYPTHELAPLGKLLRINRGNRFVSLTSMASKAVGLHEWILKEKGKDYDLADFNFTQGDVVTTMIKCAHGETVVLVHDCTLPRPYSRNARVQGTKGIWMEDNDSIYLDDDHKNHHEWEPFEPFRDKYEHPLWIEYYNKGVRSGHEGIDYLVLCAFVESAMYNLAPPIDVYDTAVYMSITCLSEQSIAMGSMPVPVPDFTNGRWIDREPFRRGKYCLEEVCHEFFENENMEENE
ncbi:MAG: Gfo/Idh/MocA family oxidoreductase [Clostridiales bacterium]|nr:Gfo/Idh/MocA family oxidoreductase [Clostridiales bacterium]